MQTIDIASLSPSPPKAEPLAVSPAEAARLAGLGRTTIYAALGSGALKSLKIGTLDRARCAAFLAALPRGRTVSGLQSTTSAEIAAVLEGRREGRQWRLRCPLHGASLLSVMATPVAFSFSVTGLRATRRARRVAPFGPTGPIRELPIAAMAQRSPR
jgi:hypothetical protein